MKRARNLIACSAVALVACAVAAPGSHADPASAATMSAPTAAAVAGAVDPVIRGALAEEGIPGAAFVFVHEDRVVYAQGATAWRTSSDACPPMPSAPRGRSPR
jgi:hypothetical protein